MLAEEEIRLLPNTALQETSGEHSEKVEAKNIDIVKV
jgi:hypothetical protein